MPFNSINYVSLKIAVITSYLKCFKSWPMGGRGGGCAMTSNTLQVYACKAPDISW